jgi:hypothetical protein
VGLAVLVEDHHGLELDRGSRVDVHELHLDHVAGPHTLLLPSDPDHRIHGMASS